LQRLRRIHAAGLNRAWGCERGDGNHRQRHKNTDGKPPRPDLEVLINCSGFDGASAR